MTERIASWIEHYRWAWESNDPADIVALFTDDAEYRDGPSTPPWVGHDEIVEKWLAARDEPGDTTFTWQVLVDTPELGVAQCVSEYPKLSKIYDNLWVVRFAADGRASSFTDWFVLRD